MGPEMSRMRKIVKLAIKHRLQNAALLIFLLLGVISCLSLSMIGTEKVLEETWYKNEKYTALFIGVGFREKDFYFMLIQGEIKYGKNGLINRDNALIYKAVELEKYDKTTNKYIQYRFPVSSEIDFQNRIVVLYFDNNDIEEYTF